MARNDIEFNTTKGARGYVCSKLLIPLIHKALSACKRYKPRKGATNTFPTNMWYDEDYKAAKRAMSESDVNKQENKKKYKKLVGIEEGLN